MLQEPWKKHEPNLTGKRPFQINGLRCISGNNLNDSSYTALVRCFPFSHTGVCMPTEASRAWNLRCHCNRVMTSTAREA